LKLKRIFLITKQTKKKEIIIIIINKQTNK